MLINMHQPIDIENRMSWPPIVTYVVSVIIMSKVENPVRNIVRNVIAPIVFDSLHDADE